MFQTYLVEPLYNMFIFLIGVMPGGDVGLAIITLTLMVRIVFYPAFTASIRTQMGMHAVQGELDEINKLYKNNAEERGRRTMALFKEHKVRPFASIIALMVQIPIFLALYFTFLREGLPNISTNLLYSFVQAPTTINIEFLGILNLLSTHVIPLAIVVGCLQYLVARYSFARTPQPGGWAKERTAAHHMQRRMILYFLPAIIAVVSYSLPAAAGLYFTAGNLISLGQEWLIRRSVVVKTP